MNTKKMKKMSYEQTQKKKEDGGNRVEITSENHHIFQEKALAARRRNKLRRQMAKDLMLDYENMKAVDLMRMEMVWHHAEGNIEEAVALAEKVAPYETPKLSSQQVDVTTKKLEEMTDEEFAEEVKRLGATHAIQ